MDILDFIEEEYKREDDYDFDSNNKEEYFE